MTYIVHRLDVLRISRFNLSSLIFGYAFLYIPVLFLIFCSFNASRNPGIWEGFSLKWYGELFKNPYLLISIANSLKIAFMSASIATFLGTISAIIHIRFQPFKTRQLMGGFLMVPLATPDVIMAFSILLVLRFFYQEFGFPKSLGMATIVIAHTTLFISHVYMMIHNRLRDFDMTLEEAALDLGATPLQVFLRITLPIISPAIFSSWLLAFALSLDDIVLASFLSGPGSTTLPILIFSQIRMGITPSINALATLLTASLSILMLFFVISRNRK